MQPQTFGLDKEFHPTLYNGCNSLSELRSKLNHVSKRSPCALWDRSLIVKVRVIHLGFPLCIKPISNGTTLCTVRIIVPSRTVKDIFLFLLACHCDLHHLKINHIRLIIHKYSTNCYVQFVYFVWFCDTSLGRTTPAPINCDSLRRWSGGLESWFTDLIEFKVRLGINNFVIYYPYMCLYKVEEYLCTSAGICGFHMP